MFRLDVSHLQALTLTLPDALSTLGSHSVHKVDKASGKVSVGT